MYLGKGGGNRRILQLYKWQNVSTTLRCLQNLIGQDAGEVGGALRVEPSGPSITL